MKKMIALVLALIQLTVFSACGGKTQTESKKETPDPGVTISDSAGVSENTGSSIQSETVSEKEDNISSANNAPSSQRPQNVSDAETGSEPDEDNTAEAKEHISDRMRRGINISGPLEAAGEVNYSSWIFDISYYETIADAGFDHVRIPVNFAHHIGEAPEYYIDTEFLRAVDLSVNNALDAELIAVIDFHGWAGRLASDFEGNKECFYKIWEQLAERYQSYPEELMFELINEPNKPISNGQLNELQLEAVRRIRRTNPTRTIALATNENNGTWNLWNTQVPPNDENLIISIHNYNTMNFTHQGANWLAGNPYSEKVHMSDEIKKSVESALEQCRIYEERTGRNVWISEWGVYLGIADQNDVAEYDSFFSSACKEKNLSYSYWEFNAGYGAYDMNTGQWKDFIINNLH